MTVSMNINLRKIHNIDLVNVIPFSKFGKNYFLKLFWFLLSFYDILYFLRLN